MRNKPFMSRRSEFPLHRPRLPLQILSGVLTCLLLFQAVLPGIAAGKAGKGERVPEVGTHRPGSVHPHIGMLPPVSSTIFIPRAVSRTGSPAKHLLNTASPKLGIGVLVAMPPALSILDEVGLLARPVSLAQIQSWRQELTIQPAPDRAARLHLWLGEWELAQSQQPVLARRHFQQAQQLTRPVDPCYGLAAYDDAISLYYEGAYGEASEAFHRLLMHRAPLNGYDRRRCTLWFRHASVAAGYHAQRSALGIPEPPQLDPRCGAAALATCLRALRLRYDAKTVLAACRVTGEGSSLQDVIDAGGKLHVQVRAVRADDKGLVALPKPLVAYVEHDHFIAVVGAGNAGVTYLCSDCGAWPGGPVRLSWKQWHALNPGLYATVTRPSSLWDKTMAAALFSPVSVPVAPTRNIRVASAISVPGLLHSKAAAWLPVLPLLRKHILEAGPAAGVTCGSKPSALHPNPLGKHSTDGDPVSLATGEEQLSPGADLVVYNPHGPAVSWGRLYNSLRPVGQGFYDGDVTYECNDFGIGWSQTYNMGVYDPSAGLNTGTKYILLPNASRISFTAPAIPTAAAPKVMCPAQAGASMLVEWDYDATSPQGHFAVTLSNRTRWITTAFNPATLCYALGQVVDRNGNAINFHYSTPPPGFAWPLLSSITDASTGTALLTVSRTTDGTGNIASVSDCYGRSVYYHEGYYPNLDIPNPWPQSYQELDHVSQIVTSCTPNPPDRTSYGYQLVSNGDGGLGNEKVQFLSTITTPSPTGTGTSTRTLTYAPNTCLIQSVTDANGNSRSYDSVDASGSPAYPSNNTKVSIKDASGNLAYSYIKGYDNNLNDTTTTDGDGVITSTLTYDATSPDPNQPTSVTDASNRSWQFAYDQFGNSISSTSPRGLTVTNTWDYTQFALGEMTKTQVSTNAGSLAPTRFAYYEPSGLPQTITAPAPGTIGSGPAVMTSFTYDFTSQGDQGQGTHGLGNLLTVTTPGNNAASAITATFNYTTDGSYSQPAALGQPLTVTDNVSKVSHMRYDALGRVVNAVDALSHETDIQYNIVGQPVQTTLPATGQTGGGQATSVSTYLYPGGPLMSAAAFDESGHQVRQVSYGYDPVGTTLSVSGSAEPITYTYDALYRLQTLTDGNSHTTHYYYSKAGHLDALTYPGYSGLAPAFDGEGWSNVTGPDSVRYPHYAADGHLLKSIDGRGTETDYAYTDPDGALTDVQYPGASSLNHHLTYDGFGRASTVTDGSGTVQFGTGTTPGYDDAGHVLNVLTTYTGLPTQTLSYGYYPNGSRQSMTTPAGAFTFAYDGDGRIVSETNPFSETSQWAYQDNGWLSSQTLGNGAMTAYTQNQMGQLTDLTTQASGTTLSEFGSIAYDGAGNRTAVTSSIPAVPAFGGQTSYQYDAKDQLISETSQRGSGYTNGFAYDAAGNPTTSRSSGPNIFNADNQISAAGYTYDGNGNPMTYKGAAVSYDAEDRPTQFGTQLTAGYTGSGLRAWKQGAGGKTYFLYDGAAPVCELDSSGNVTATNTFGGAGLLSRHIASGSAFYTFDERGNVAQRLDATGSPTSSAMYDAYGASASAVPDPFGFGGQFGYYTDSETGLILCQHRYYDSATGRFINRDPIGYGGGLNLYAYCANNPVNSVDPSGFDAQNDGGDNSPWYDQLANAGDFGTNAQKDPLNKFWAGDPTHLIPTIANTALDLGNGLLHIPSAIGHVGEGTGTFAGDPTLNNLGGVVGDALTAISVVAPFLAPEAAGAGQALREAEPVDKALKSDAYHRAATFVRDEAAKKGTHFPIVGNDGVPVTLTQVPGGMNGIPGRFEYIVNPAGNLTHQLFVPFGTINGIPIKP